jgi:hypothetical protein
MQLMIAFYTNDTPGFIFLIVEKGFSGVNLIL